MRQEALAKAAQEAYEQQTSYGYSEPSYYEAPVASTPAPAPQPTYGVGFDQLDSDSMADFKKGKQAGWNWNAGRNNFY